MPTLASVNPSPITEPVPAPPVNPPSPTPQQPVLTPSVAGPRLSSSSTELATSGNASELPQHQPKPLNAESLVEKRQRARSAVTGLKTLNLVQTPVTPNTPPPVQSPATRDSPRRSSQSTTTSAPSNVESVAPPALKRRVNRIPPSPPTRMRTRSFSKALHAAQSLAASKSAETVGKEVVQTGVTSSKEAIPPSVPVAPDSGQPTPKKRGRPFKNPQPANRIQLPPSTRMRLRSVSKALHLSQLAASKDAVPSGQQQRQPSPEKVAPMFKPTQTQSTAAAILPSEESQHVGKEANCVSSTSTTPQTTMTAQQRLLRPPRKMAPMSKPTRTQSATRIPSSEKSQIVGKEATCVSPTSTQAPQATTTAQQQRQPSPEKVAPMFKPTQTQSTAAAIVPSEESQHVGKEATCVSTTSTQTPQTTMTAQQRLLRPPRKMAPMSKPTRTQSATKIPSSEKSQNTEKEATCVPTTSTQTPQVTTTAPSSSLNSNAPPVPPRKVFVMSKPKQTPSAASGIPSSETGQKAKKVNLSLFLRKPLEYTEDGLLVLDKNGPKATKAARRCSHSDSDSDYAENPAVPDPPTPMPSPSPVPAFSNRKRTHSIAESHASSQSKRPNLATASPLLFNDNPTDDDFVFPNFKRVSSVNATVLPKAVEPAALSPPPALPTVNQHESTHPAPISPPAPTPLVNEVVPSSQSSTDKQSEPPALKRKRASPAAVSPTSSQPKPCLPTSSQPKPSKSTSVPSKPVMTVELVNVTPLDNASIYANRPPATAEVTKPMLSETATVNESADLPSPSHSMNEPSPPPVPAIPDQEHDSADESDAEPKHKRYKYVPLATPVLATRFRVRKAHQKQSETHTPPKGPKARQPRSKSAAVRKIPTSGKSDSHPTSVSKTDTPRIIQLPSSSQRQKAQDALTTSAASSKPVFEPAPRPHTPIEPEPKAAYDVVPKLAPSVHPKSGYDPHIIGGLAESCWNAVLEAVEKEELEGIPVKPNYPCVMPWQRDPADPTFGLTPENIAARNKMALPLPRQPGDTLPRSYLCPDGLGIISEEQYIRIVFSHNLAVDIGMPPQIRSASEPRQKVPAKKKPAPTVSKTPKKKPVPAAKTPSRDQSGSNLSSMPRLTAMSTKPSHPGASKASMNPVSGPKTPVRCHPVVIKPVRLNQKSTASTSHPPAPLIRVPDRPTQGIVMVSDNNNDNQFRPPPAEILESRHVAVSQQNARPTRPSNPSSNRLSHPSRHARNPVQVGVPKRIQRDISSSSDSLE